MLETLGVDGVLIQASEQLQRIEDSLIGVFLIQGLLPLIDLTHILQQKHSGCDKVSLLQSDKHCWLLFNVRVNSSRTNTQGEAENAFKKQSAVFLQWQPLFF